MKRMQLNGGAPLSRREFNRLTMAAFGGAVVGVLTTSGCKTGGQTDAAKHNPELLAEEPHVCRGLNTCNSKGKGGDNACAGQGKCATAEAHSCAGHNACKGQGGCGEYPGQNTCKAQGECAVPLKENVWKKARAAFERQMAQAGKTVGNPPAQ